MEYDFIEVMKAFSALCNYGNVTNNLEWCGNECPLYKAYGDECSDMQAISECYLKNWVKIVMEWKKNYDGI